MDTIKEIVKSPPGVFYLIIATATFIFWVLSFMR